MRRKGHCTSRGPVDRLFFPGKLPNLRQPVRQWGKGNSGRGEFSSFRGWGFCSQIFTRCRLFRDRIPEIHDQLKNEVKQFCPACQREESPGFLSRIKGFQKFNCFVPRSGNTSLPRPARARPLSLSLSSPGLLQSVLSYIRRCP